MTMAATVRNAVVVGSYPVVVLTTFGVFGLLAAAGMHVTPAPTLPGWQPRAW